MKIWDKIVKKHKIGNSISGRVVKITRLLVYVDIGEQFYGTIAFSNVQKGENVDLDRSFKIGDYLEGVILGLYKHKNIEDSTIEIGLWQCFDKKNREVLKKMRLRTIESWNELVERLKDEDILEGVVSKHEVYGVIVDFSEKFYGLIEFHNLKGEIPALNSKIKCKVLGFSLDENKIQFSYVALADSW